MHGYQDRNDAAGVRMAVGQAGRTRRPVVPAGPSPVPCSLPDLPAVVLSPAFIAAQDAMTRGCEFLIRRGRAGHMVSGLPCIHAKVALRRVGNCLKELDRLLSLLLDECVGVGGMIAAKRRAFERSHDTSRKLRRVDRLNGCFTPDTIRLRAIGRIREVACNDQVLAHVPWASHDMAVATAGHLGRNADDRGDDSVRPWEVTDEALGAIAGFYLSIAKRVLGYYGVAGVQLDFSTDRAQNICAIVACDGI